jgi:hypothetical protein
VQKNQMDANHCVVSMAKKEEALSQFFRLLKNKFNKNTSRGFVGRGTHAVKFALNL